MYNTLDEESTRHLDTYNTLGEESTCHVDIIEKKKWEVSLRKMLEEWNGRRNSPMLFA
jgi:hypothetical protein